MDILIKTLKNSYYSFLLMLRLLTLPFQSKGGKQCSAPCEEKPIRSPKSSSLEQFVSQNDLLLCGQGSRSLDERPCKEGRGFYPEIHKSFFLGEEKESPP